MADEVFCKNCGILITGEENGQLKPCPECGSFARSITVHPLTAVLGITGGISTLQVITYPERLIATAARLITDGEFSIAVVVAHMACEISVERALAREFVIKGIDYLEESVEDLLPGYNLANDRLRKLYNALTGKEIEKQSFWPAFKESAHRRNQVVHEGSILIEAEAKASFKATSELVEFLK
jgi:hypothetical protein